MAALCLPTSHTVNLQTHSDHTKPGWRAWVQRGEYWRLKDAVGKPPGVMGWWPSRAVTFLENHDTVRLNPKP